MPLKQPDYAGRRIPLLSLRRWRGAAFAALLLAAASSGRAETPAEVCGGPVEQFERIFEEHPACRKDAGFLFRLGRRLNQAHRYGEAVDRLEGALMLEPGDWWVRLEYAIALEGSGDGASAAAILAELAGDPAVDGEIRKEIERIQARVKKQGAQSGLAPGRTVWGLAAGYDDNLLGSTRYNNFQLTLPDGNLAVEVHPDQRPRGGGFLRFDLSHEGEVAWADSARWRYGLAGSYRWSVDYAPADLAHMGALLERSPGAGPGFYTQAIIQQLYRGGSAALRQGQLGGGGEAGVRLFGAVCRLRLGVEGQWLAYPTSPLLDGRYGGLVGQLACPAEQWQLQLRVGEDRPVHDLRPGGPQHQQSLRVAKTLPVGDAANLVAEYEYYHQRDRVGYSTLLDNNARRSIDRNIYRLEYRWRLFDLSPFVGLEWLDQDANLALFSPRNRIVNLGVRGFW